MTDLYFSRNLKRTAELILSYDGSTLTTDPGSYGATAVVEIVNDPNFGSAPSFRILGLPPGRQWHVVGTPSGPTPAGTTFWTPALTSSADGGLIVMFLPIGNSPPAIPPRAYINISEVV